MRIVCLIITILLMVFHLQSCDSGNESPNIYDPVIEEIQTKLPELNIASGVYVGSSMDLSPLWVFAVPNSDLLVVVDDVDWTIRLIQLDGTELAEAGGAGRGPGEFEVINQLHIGYDKQLYVLDRLLKRLTVFDIEDEKLNYLSTIVLEHAQNMHLQTIYITERGNYGVFNKLDNYQTWENRFHLYRLDEAFRPLEHLLEMPGNEKVEISSNFFIDHPLGSLTFWDIEGEWFYYITSHSFDVNKFHLETGVRETEQYFKTGERINTPQLTNFLKTRLHQLIENRPQVEQALEESPVLPLFNNLLVQDNRILFSMYHSGGEHGVIIYVDQTSEDVMYMKTPPYFRRISLRDSTLYGIDFTDPDKESQMMFLSLDL